jgi:hypothetical protein
MDSRRRLRAAVPKVASGFGVGGLMPSISHRVLLRVGVEFGRVDRLMVGSAR